ncbi:MAG: hypothetical protein OEV74_08830 [Cyclobacteriaceae bacterium]|nr:hypothetical protein [Cyclobacteriaceae bacterium]MDH4296369.1 hypothetical protein [Cyclobacteriaceae bacterium]MDH5248310.1 hypothetical protein [Cyclobacteriaceae bacterium]
MNLRKNISRASTIYLLTSALALTCTIATAQQASAVDSLLKKFDQYRIHNLPEKIYAHLDQDLYLTGEILWFKLYVVDGALHKPIDISKVAYFEILDKDNNPVLQAKIALRDGVGNGSLFLPASIQSGNYTIRVYTTWMKNFSPDFFFHKSITIVNTFRKLELEEPDKASKPDAQFFPEGGNLVYGLKTKLAFRVINNAGKGIDFNGVVVDQNNDTITSFKPQQFGMGNFELTPAAGHEYRALIEDEEGRQHTYTITPVLAAGYVMCVTDSTDNFLSISVTTNLSNSSTAPVYVFVHARNIVSAANMHTLKQGHATILVPKQSLQGGISHITLFDSDLHPVCERLYFVPPDKKLMIDVQSNQREFGLRRKVSVDINTLNEKAQPQSANMSVAVYKIDSLQQEKAGDIQSYLWLSSDLRGTIESPEYFVGNSPAVMQSIDNIMLTHGWRRFIWTDILTNNNTALDYAPEFRGHIIRAKVTEPLGTPSKGVKSYLSSPSKNIQLYASLSDDNGEVKFEMKDFRGPRKIIVQTNTLIDSTSHIQILSPFADSFSVRSLPAFYLSSSLQKQILSRSISMQVQDVFYQDRSNRFRVTTEDSTAFYGKADATYYLDDYTRFPVMEEVMREYVPGVMVRKRKDGFHFMTLDQVNKRVFDEDPMILLDGIPLFDVDQIMDFDPLLVKKLEVLNRRYYMGILSLPGIVSYTTYSGDLNGFELDPKSIKLDYEGLQLQREFYVPKYETPKERGSRLPDQRTLLHWAPDLVSSKDGKQHIEFYTSDMAGNYRIVVEGLTKDGLTGSATGTFSVRPNDN